MAGNEDKFTICGIAGSLREKSFNRALLRAAQEIAPDGVDIRIFDRISEIPLYNADVEAEGDPEPVQALKQAIDQADALLIATPEYNHGVPGLLKNALDWASRPARRTVLGGKPVAILGASPGITGTARAQSQLRQMFVFTDSPVLPQPEVLVYRAAEKFDDQLNLTDERTRAFVGKLLNGLVDWSNRLSG